MTHTEALPEADSPIRDKAIRLFNYLKELTELRFEVQRNCDSYEDVICGRRFQEKRNATALRGDLRKDPTFDAWIRVERPKRKRPRRQTLN